MKYLFLTAGVAVLVGVVVVAQVPQTQTTGAGDWSMYSRDLGGSRFSPLSEINAANVGRLTEAWTVRLTQPAGRRGGGPPAGDQAAAGRGAEAAGRGAAPGRGAGAAGNPAVVQGRGGVAAAVGPSGVAQGSNPQATPIVIGGVMYLPARGNQVL